MEYVRTVSVESRGPGGLDAPWEGKRAIWGTDWAETYFISSHCELHEYIIFEKTKLFKILVWMEDTKQSIKPRIVLSDRRDALPVPESMMLCLPCERWEEGRGKSLQQMTLLPDKRSGTSMSSSERGKLDSNICQSKFHRDERHKHEK